MSISYHHRVTFISLLALLAACGGGSSMAPPTVTPVGNWYLESIGGRPLPDAGSQVSLVSGSLGIGAGGSFQAVYGYIFGSDPTIHNDNRAGTWTVAPDNTLTMNESGHGISTGLFIVNSLTVDWGDTGSPYLYRRR